MEDNRKRLHPIIMTTLSMIIGMLLIMLASGNDVELKNGTTWVISGRLISTILFYESAKYKTS
jgi:multidrug efflux pump subunit AcrB